MRNKTKLKEKECIQKKRFKFAMAGVLSLLIVCSSSIAFAKDEKAESKSSDITVTVNGVNVETDTSPVMENDRVLLPMRAIFETLGCNVTYREQDGKQYVSAVNGGKQIILEIGKNEIIINGDLKQLDIAAKIQGDTTLVPVRAVAEALNADVAWSDETNTVNIRTKQGEHTVKSIVGENAIKDADGTCLMYIDYVYPAIDNKDNNEYINKINEEYKLYAEKFISAAETMTDDAKELLKIKGADSYRPMEFNLSYAVHTDKNGIISITNYEFYNTGGAHPNTARISKTYDTKNMKELDLSDIINGTESEIHATVYDLFVRYFEQSDGVFTSQNENELENECDNVKFYLSDNSVVLYFDVYQVAPYVAGYPTVEIPYSEDVFKIKL